MKIFIHDEKHDRILAEFDIGDHPLVITRMEGLVEFLNEINTDRYNRLVVAKDHYTKYDDFSETVFH